MLLGSFPYEHVLSPPEGQVLVDLLSSGFSIYVEANNMWGYWPPTPFSDYDGVDGGSESGPVIYQGLNVFEGMIGQAHAGLDLTGLDSSYALDNAFRLWTDQLVPTGDSFPPDIPGANAGVIWPVPTSSPRRRRFGS